MNVNIKNIFAVLLIFTLETFALGDPIRHLGNVREYFQTGFDPPFQLEAARAESEPQMTMYRLPDDLQPISYVLKIAPNLSANFTYTGETNITIAVKKPTKSIFLHSNKLNIRSVQLTRDDKKLDLKFSLLPADQLLKVNVKNWLFRQNVIIMSVKFEGTLGEEMRGFYRSSYRVGNQTKWLATTQFESTFARWAFPCFDEPKYRATFDISVARYPHQRAISNMPLKSTSPPDRLMNDRVWDTFDRTPPMPTYLVAFIVSEFLNVTDNEGKVKVWARENAIGDAKYGQIKAKLLLKHMEQFVGIAYTMPKLDVVAIPDFRAGAMENWGLTTYRERYSLYNQKVYPERNKEFVTTVIAHELSHQWFGDLVTPAWWDYLWLNEGFATYFEYFLTEMEEPTWRIGDQFVVEIVQDALSVDGISVHRSMTDELKTPQEIERAFDSISYDKAGSVIRMMEHIVTTSIFKKALHSYLRSRSDAGGVAEPTHLFASFDNEMPKEGKLLADGLLASTVFEKYSKQIGYPLVTLSRQSNSGIFVKQEPYRSPRSSRNITQKTWPVPISCTKKSNPDFSNTQPTMWLLDDKPKMLTDQIQPNEWVLCNIQQTGYYRVNYDLDNWNYLIEQLHSSHTKIHHLNRAQLIDDSYTLASDDKLPFDISLDVLRYLENENDPIPWYSGLMVMSSLVNNNEGTMASQQIRHFVKHIIEHFYNRAGFYNKNTDSHSMKSLRPFFTSIATDLEIPDAITKATAEFYSKNDLSDIPPDVKAAVMCTAIKLNSNLTVWNKLWDLYNKSNVEVEKGTVLMAVGCANDLDLLKKYLFKLIDSQDHDIRKQDYRLVFRSISRSSRGVEGALNFIRAIIPNLGNFTEGRSIVLQLLSHIGGSVKTDNHFHILHHLIEDTEKLDEEKYGDVKHTLKKLKENAETCMKKNNEMAAKILTALNKPAKTTTAPTLPTKSPSVASSLLPNIFTLFTIFVTQLVYLKMTCKN